MLQFFFSTVTITSMHTKESDASGKTKVERNSKVTKILLYNIYTAEEWKNSCLYDFINYYNGWINF